MHRHIYEPCKQYWFWGLLLVIIRLSSFLSNLICLWFASFEEESQTNISYCKILKLFHELYANVMGEIPSVLEVQGHGIHMGVGLLDLWDCSVHP